MQLDEIGRILRERREELGLEVRDVQQATKIREKYIRAIEEGDTSVMPAPVYTKGFIRALGNQLGLDGFSLMQEYSTEPRAPVVEKSEVSSGPQPSTKPARSEPTKGASSQKPARRAVEPGRRRSRRAQFTQAPAGPPLSRPRRGRSLSALLVIVVVLALLVGGGYAINHFLLSGAVDTQGSQNPPATGDNGPDTTPAPDTEPPATGDSGGPSAPTETTPELAATKTVNAEAHTIEVTLTAEQGSLPGELEVGVVSSGRCWVRVSSQSTDAVVYEGTLVNGDEKTWTDPLGLTVRAGAPGALSFTVNSVDVGTPVDQGVWNFVFRMGSN